MGEEPTEEQPHEASPLTVAMPIEPRSELKHSSSWVTTSLTIVLRQSLCGRES